MLFTETFPPTQTSLSNGTSWSSSAAVHNFDIQGGVSGGSARRLSSASATGWMRSSTRCGLPRTTAAFPATIMGPSSH